MGDRDVDKDAPETETKKNGTDAPEADADRDDTNADEGGETDSNEAAADEAAADEAAADEAADDEAAADDAEEGEEGEESAAASESVKPKQEAPAAKPPAPAGPSPLARVGKFFWMGEALEKARQQGFDADKPGWQYYELAREAVVAAQRLGELSEAKQGVLLLHREAALLLARAELVRAGSEGRAWADFAKVEAAQPLLEKLSEDERQLVAEVLDQSGIDALAKLPKDRRTTLGKALGTLASKLHEQLEKEANRVASVLYARWFRIIGVAVAVIVVLGLIVTTVRRSAQGPNLALHKTVTLSSSSRQYGVPAERLVDGDRNELAFHTEKERDPWAQIDLGEVKRVHDVVVYNRPSQQDRAVPLVIEISQDNKDFEQVAKRDDIFNVWDAKINKKARYVRLKVLKSTYFHLAEVEIH